MAVQNSTRSSAIYAVEQATVFRVGSRRFLTRATAVKTYALRKIRAKHPCECESPDYSAGDPGYDCGCSALREKLLPRYLRVLRRAELPTGPAVAEAPKPEVYEVRYPFVRETYREPDADEFGGGTVATKSWRPGIRPSSGTDPYGEWTHNEADGIGLMRLTVVSRHTPSPKHRERVFFTREWVDPDGHGFGKKHLRILGAAAFTHIATGFRVEYEMAKPLAETRS